MKKISIILLLSFLVSCSGSDEHRLMIWHTLRPEGRVILQDQLRRFKARLLQIDRVRYQRWEFDERYYGTEEARTNFIVAALAGKGPALFRGPSDNIGPFVELAVIQPLEPLLSPAFLDSFVTEPISATVWHQGHLYQLADEIGNHLCLVYNKKLVPEPPETIGELIQLGKKLLANPPTPELKYVLAWNFTEPYFAVPFIGGYGGWLMDEAGNPTLNTDAVVKAAQLIYDLGNKHQIIPRECDYEIANALFSDGYAAMIINGPWSWGSYLNRNLDIGITRIPKIDETGLWASPIVSPLGYSLNVNATGETREIAIQLLKFLTEAEAELEFTRKLGTLPTRKIALSDSFVTNDPITQSSLYQLYVGRPMPTATELRWVWDAMRPGYQAIFTGELTPEAAAAQMQAQALKLIQENRE